MDVIAKYKFVVAAAGVKFILILEVATCEVRGNARVVENDVAMWFLAPSESTPQVACARGS